MQSSNHCAGTVIDYVVLYRQTFFTWTSCTSVYKEFSALLSRPCGEAFSNVGIQHILKGDGGKVISVPTYTFGTCQVSC